MAEAKFIFDHVLLIDDSEIDILVNRRLIELTYFASSITVTGSVEQALHFLREECSSAKSAPDWIFLDMHLPMMNGFEFLEEFKTLPEYITTKTRIIILSVFQKHEQFKKILDYKFVAGQLDKPLTQQALNALSINAKSRVSASS